MVRYTWLFVVTMMLAALPTARAAPDSKVFPMSDEGGAYMIENLPNLEQIGYPVGADVSEVPKELYPVVEVPAYIELMSSVYHYSRLAPARDITDIVRDGQAYKRYVFPPPAKSTARWALLMTQWVPHPSEADRQAPGVFAWHFETPDGPEPEQAIAIKLLPELLPASPPKRILVHMYTCANLDVDPERLPEVLTLLQRGGANLIGIWESRGEDLKAAGVYEMGMRLHANQGGISGWKDFGAQTPDEYTVDKDGNIVEGEDPQYVIDRDGEPWQRTLATCKNLARQVDVMTQDIEWGPIWDTGFSEAGIKAFAEQNNLNPAELTPQTIWRDYRKQWGDFRANQQLILASYFTEAAREANPDCLTIWLPGSPYTGTDPDLMSDMIELGEDSLGRTVYLTYPFPTERMQEGFDILEPMWYGHGVGQCRQGFEWTKAITSRVKLPFVPLFLGQGREYYYPGGDPGEVLRAMLWGAMLGGAEGYGFWLSEFSPLQWAWLARTNREISVVEDILLDGEPDRREVRIRPMPKKHLTLVSGQQRQSFPVPDFAKVALTRSFTSGDHRLIGVVNLDLGMEVYYKVQVRGLPAGEYQVVNVTENTLVVPDRDVHTFTADQLEAGLLMVTPAKYGVTILDVAAADQMPAAELKLQVMGDIEAAYAAYKEPDTEGSVLAERGGLSIRYDMVGAEAEPSILIESPLQQVWIRPQAGGRITEWRVKDGDRKVVEWLPPHGGAAMDLFWSPADAHWSGDEQGAYEVVYTKIHGGKAYVRLRQTKATPSLQGLVLTKTIAVPLRSTDVEVQVSIENPGPAPEIGFAYWAHHVFRPGQAELEAAEEQYADIYMQTDEGVTRAPLESVVWAKPAEPFLPGNESFEERSRNGVTVANWIAQHNPVTGEALLCQVEDPPVAQFYSWRSGDKRDLSAEWMYRHVTLGAGETWNTKYWLRYLRSVEPEDLPRSLYPAVP